MKDIIEKERGKRGGRREGGRKEGRGKEGREGEEGGREEIKEVVEK